MKGRIRIFAGNPDVSERTRINWEKNAASWGKEDALAGLDNCGLSGWGEEINVLYDDAYRKQILINLITGENDEQDEGT